MNMCSITCHGDCKKCEYENLALCSVLLQGTKVKKGDIIEVHYIEKKIKRSKRKKLKSMYII